MKIVSSQHIYSMSRENKPVMTVNPGENIMFHTKDCFGNQLEEPGACIGQLDWEHINPAAGPVYVEGAQKGDVLKVEILTIETSECGTMCALPGDGVLGKYVKEEQIKRLPVRDGQVIFNDTIQFPLKKMIGVIGVAPQEGRVPCGTPGKHGGNMDNTRIGEGAVLYLPVFCPGALFALGDVHAAMGDGEIMVSGVEISAKVTVKLDLIKDRSIQEPMLEDARCCYTISSHESVETAVQSCTQAMSLILQERLGLSGNEAGMLMSAVGDLRFCQVVDPKRTVTMAMPKEILPHIF